MTTFNLTLRPRFNDTDALGHINNASVATWFEEARLPVFQLFVPNLDVKAWNLIVASIQIQYKAQLHYQHEVQVVTLVQKIGTTSFTLLQLASQNSTLAAEGALPKGFDGSAFSYLDAYSAVARYEDLLPSADRDVAKKAFAAVKEAIDALEAHALQKNANS